MKTFLSKALGIFMVLTLTACAPHVSTYRYISLEDIPGIRVEAMGEAELENLYFHSEMPVRYSLERKSYYISFHVNKESYFPSLTIVVSSADDGGPLKLEHQRYRKAKVSQSSCGPSFYRNADQLSRLGFGWSECDELKQQQIISFDVLSADGEIIGQEDIPFELKSNGFYYVVDAI